MIKPVIDQNQPPVSWAKSNKTRGELEESQKSAPAAQAEQIQELRRLLEVSKRLAAIQASEPPQRLILEQLRMLAPYQRAVIYAYEQGQFSRQAAEGDFTGDQRALTTIPQPALAVEIQRPISLFDESAALTQPEAAFRKPMAALLRQVFASREDWLWLPLRFNQQSLGAILLQNSSQGAFTSHQTGLLQEFAGLAGQALENTRLYQQAAFQERRKLARELHDSVTQALYGIILGAKTARACLPDRPEQAIEPVDYAIALAGSGLAEIRALIFDLRPEALSEDGLVAAIRTQAQAFQTRHPIEIIFEAQDEPQMSFAVQEAMYRVAQEALNNIARHASASQVNICLEWQRETLFMEIRDNGQGFTPESAFPGHLGLRSMRQRVEGLGGTFDIRSAPGQGTTLSMRVPLSATLT